MAYLGELRTNWRPLLAATFGLATGQPAHMYTINIIAPHLLRDFGWSMAEFALVNSLGLLTFFAYPAVGRLADVLGARRTAAIGIVALPLLFIAYSMMTGSIVQYIIIYGLQTTICITTTGTVYSRLPVECVARSRGLALAIVASGPAITGAIGGPILNGFIEANDWRAAYHALAVFSVITGTITLLLLPADGPQHSSQGKTRRAREDYPLILRDLAFWTLVASMFLCNLPQVIVLSQLKIVLLESGVSAASVSIMLSTFALGVLVGRFVAGFALDRYAPHVVAAICMGLPSVGLLILATGTADTAMAALAVMTIGFSFGAEGDIVAFLVARKFGVRIYGSVLGLVTAAIVISASAGAAFLSLTLNGTGSFSLFLLSSGAAVLVGALLLLLLEAHETKRDGAGLREADA